MLRIAVLVPSLCALMAGAQATQRIIRFLPGFNGAPLELDKPLLTADGSGSVVTQFRFFVSHITLFDRGVVVSTEPRCHLIDAANELSWEFPLPLDPGVRVDSLAFLFGVDSTTNASGAHGGDLDPTTGMYWTWNSGYINWKLEGTCARCTTKGNTFQFHLGGFLPPHQSAQWVSHTLTHDGPLEVFVDVAPLLDGIGLQAGCTVMSPGEEAVRLSRIAAGCSRLRP